MIARHAVTKEFFAYGTKAEEMEGKAPRDIEIVHPMKRSAIIDYNGAAYLFEFHRESVVFEKGCSFIRVS